ncbi:diguanylate cyclase [Colwelliaceae bacterium 6441]
MNNNAIKLFSLLILLWVNTARSDNVDVINVNYCIDPAWAPYESIENNQHIGISKQYLDIFAKDSSFSFNLIPTSNWNEALEFVKKGKCQLLPMLNKSPEREEYLVFSDSYFRAPNALYSHYNQTMIGNLSNITTQSVAVVSGYRMHHYLKEHFPNMNIILVENELAGLTKVENQKIDYFIGSYYAANKIIQDLSLAKLRIVGIAEIEDNLRIGVNRNSKHLLPYFNQRINSLTEQDHKKVFSNLKALNFVKQTDYTMLISLATFFSLIILIILIGYSRSLRFSNELALKNITLKKLHQQLDEKNKQLAELAIKDPLTMLYNRAHLEEMIQQQINLKDRYQTKSCLIMIDVDDFKQVNDKFGHKLGDNILISLSSILTKCARNSDVVARWGGEEFVLLCPETDLDEAIELAKRFQKALGQLKSDTLPSITCSVGIAELHAKDSADEWFISADKAMYKAKNQGKNAIHITQSDHQ